MKTIPSKRHQLPDGVFIDEVHSNARRLLLLVADGGGMVCYTHEN